MEIDRQDQREKFLNIGFRSYIELEGGGEGEVGVGQGAISTWEIIFYRRVHLYFSLT